MGLISEEKLGRSKILRTTASFCDYFNLSQDSRQMKKQIQQIMEELKSAQPGAARPAQPQEAQANLPQEPQTNLPQEKTNPAESSEPEKTSSQ
jgi:RNA processing factor Prp31